ncbi:MAG: hypothetical protein J3Q66DRAFT_351860, partial [Benniella sp.]
MPSEPMGPNEMKSTPEPCATTWSGQVKQFCSTSTMHHAPCTMHTISLCVLFVLRSSTQSITNRIVLAHLSLSLSLSLSTCPPFLLLLPGFLRPHLLS